MTGAEATTFPSRPISSATMSVLCPRCTVGCASSRITDSTATVIGAMIVAPLMGPIMATAAAVVMGSAERAAQSLALVVAGVISVIVFATGLAWIVPDVAISFSENSQLTSRIAPGLMALRDHLAVRFPSVDFVFIAEHPRTWTVRAD